jgi:hypothetical protein
MVEVGTKAPDLLRGSLFVNGEWRVENGEWRVENGEWRVENCFEAVVSF